jgi:sugar O-acyltransferase (sialic acid O-acetyltransferase NeuD family)
MDSKIPSTVLLYGNGGHAKVVREAVSRLDMVMLHYFDDSEKEHTYDPTYFPDVGLHVAVGDNYLRGKIASLVQHSLLTIVHPQADVSPSVIMGKGSFVGVRAVLMPDVSCEKCCIFNTAVIIEHDCVLGEYVHIAPGSILCGNVRVGDYTLIGAGTVVNPNLRIGKNVIIGSGSVVTQDVADGMIVAGAPARVIRS